MNNDLISRSALRKAVNDFYDNSFKGTVSSDLIKYAEAVDSLIDNAPTIELEPSCVLTEFGKCSYKETGCSDCKIKSNLRYMCHGSAWQELQALREFKEKHEKKGKWIFDKEHSITIDMFKCSVCGGGGHTHFNYCPNCGIQMEK